MVFAQYKTESEQVDGPSAFHSKHNCQHIQKSAKMNLFLHGHCPKRPTRACTKVLT